MVSKLVINTYSDELSITDSGLSINNSDGEMEFQFSGSNLLEIRDFYNSLFVENETPKESKTNKYAVSLVYQNSRGTTLKHYVINAVSEPEAFGNGVFKDREEMNSSSLIMYEVIKL